jgi:hypothetical protein
MKGFRLRSRLAPTIVGVIGMALVLALAVGGLQRLAQAPARADAQRHCGDSDNLVPWEADVILTPDSGPAGSSVRVYVAGIAPNIVDSPIQVLWDWDPVGLDGELIGSDTIPWNQTWINVDAVVPQGAEPDGHTVTACWYRLASDTWFYKSAPFEVSVGTPTPTPTPTPLPVTPTPAPAHKMHDCPKPGKWAIAVWQGADDTDTAEALATCGEEVDAVYALDPDTQAWQRYLPERPDITNLLTLKDNQGVIARGKATLKPTPTPAHPPTPTPTPTPSPANQMHNCPQPGKWAIAVWEGANEIDTGEALATCAEEVEAVYALDPDSQAWKRYFPERADISNLPMLINGQAVIARGKATFGLQGHIVFVSDRDGNDEIYVMKADGTGQARLTNNPARDWEPAWSPDGSKLAFASDRAGNLEVDVLDAKGVINLTNNPAADGDPDWGP